MSAWPRWGQPATGPTGNTSEAYFSGQRAAPLKFDGRVSEPTALVGCVPHGEQAEIAGCTHSSLDALLTSSVRPMAQTRRAITARMNNPRPVIAYHLAQT